MWIGRAVNPAILNTLFGLNSLEGADMQTLRIIRENSDFSSRVDAVVTALRQDRARYVGMLFSAVTFRCGCLPVDCWPPVAELPPSVPSPLYLKLTPSAATTGICSCTSFARATGTRRPTSPGS